MVFDVDNIVFGIESYVFDANTIFDVEYHVFDIESDGCFQKVFWYRTKETFCELCSGGNIWTKETFYELCSGDNCIGVFCHCDNVTQAL